MLAVERYGSVRKYAPMVLQAFTFRSARRHDPLLAALDMLKLLSKDGRLPLPARFPVGHLREQTRKMPERTKPYPASGYGSDIFGYSRGDGHDTIIEAASGDQLLLTDINPTDVTLIRNAIDLTIVVAESAPGAGGTTRLLTWLRQSR